MARHQHQTDHHYAHTQTQSSYANGCNHARPTSQYGHGQQAHCHSTERLPPNTLANPTYRSKTAFGMAGTTAQIARAITKLIDSLGCGISARLAHALGETLRVRGAPTTSARTRAPCYPSAHPARNADGQAVPPTGPSPWRQRTRSCHNNAHAATSQASTLYAC